MGVEKSFEDFYKETNGYQRITTFVSDLMIAQLVSGASGIKDTFNRVTKAWLSDYKYYTEFCLSLNFLAWRAYYQNNDVLSKLYGDLYKKAEKLIYEKYANDDEKIRYVWHCLD